jgi:hypothetical protein
MKKILFAIVMMICMQGAFATTLQDVSACKKDMVCMSQTAKQFLKEHPNSDKGYYILAQIEANRGDFRTAAAAMKKAESLASSMSPYPSFAGSAEQYNKLKSKISIGLNQTQVAQNNRPATQTYQSPITQSNSNRIEVASPKDTSKSSGGNGGMGIFFGILGLIVIAAGAFWLISSNQKKKALQKQKTEQMAQLNDYIEKTNTALLISKTDGLTNLQSEAQQTIEDLTAMMQQVRNGNFVSDYQMNMISNKVSIIKKTADSGKDWSAATAQAAQPVQPQYQQPVQQHSGYSAPSYHQQPPVQQSQTVIVERSGSDLLTGMMLNEMMHSHRSHDEPRRETVVVNNYNYESNSNDEIDFGGRDSENSSSNSDFDFGGSDSSSSNSNDEIDFGGSDSSDSSKND